MDGSDAIYGLVGSASVPRACEGDGRVPMPVRRQESAGEAEGACVMALTGWQKALAPWEAAREEAEASDVMIVQVSGRGP